MYIIKYSTGNYSDYRETDLFVTKSKTKAEEYIKKFNALIIKVNQHYAYMEEKYGYYTDEFYEKVCMDRKHTFAEFNKVFFYEIDLR